MREAAFGMGLDDVTSDTSHVLRRAHARLESARAVIESKFSSAGGLIENALNTQSQLLASLGVLEATLDPVAISRAIADLVSMSRRLEALDASIVARRQRLNELVRYRQTLAAQIADMEGSLRYLRVFAVNIKVTAAGTEAGAELFARFAQEMQEDIVGGAKQLAEFVARLDELSAKIARAEVQQKSLEVHAARVLRSVPAELSRDAGAIGHYHKEVARLTSRVRSLAQTIEGKMATALSALQVGDMTRQRVEHVQRGLTLLEEAELGRDAERLEPGARQQLRCSVQTLLTAQIDALHDDFVCDVNRLIKQLSEIGSSSVEILGLLGETQAPPSSGGESAFRSLERSLAGALALIESMDAASHEASALECDTRAAVDDLVTRVGDIQRLNESVQFIAINTTLRASRMGESGKPLHVVAQEVRLYADKMEDVAVHTLSVVESLGRSAAVEDGDTDLLAVKASLSDAVQRLGSAAEVIENEIAQGCRQAETVVAALGSASRNLGFDADVGEALREVSRCLEPPSNASMPASGAALAQQEAIFAALYGAYTMARERDVHQSVVGEARAEAA
jgi:methyl-accepting chemotaxis protein